MRVLRGLIFGTALCLSACSTLTPTANVNAQEAFKAGAYTLDKDHAALLVRISHFGLSSYVGRFNEVDGSLDFDVNNLSAARATLTAQTASLDVNNSNFQAKLIGPSWLDSAAYPQAVFTLENITVTGENTGIARGALNLKGIVQPVEFKVKFLGGLKNPLTRKYTVGFEARGAIKRSDYGITKYLSMAGDKFDFDTIEIEFNGEFQKTD